MWSKLTGDFEKEKSTKNYEVVLRKKYNINSGKFKFVIKRVNSDYIVIKTNDNFYYVNKKTSVYGQGNTFKIYFDYEVILTTQTMDSGDRYYLKLIRL